MTWIARGSPGGPLNGDHSQPVAQHIHPSQGSFDVGVVMAR
ncbi:hypothetical protein [Sporichthya polymorpha]|nr:hypothetical protein [Sporichthya polymorpha]